MEAAGSGEQKESGDLYSWSQGGLPGGGEEAADWKAGGTPWTKTEEVGVGLEGKETFPTIPPTETCPSNGAWTQATTSRMSAMTVPID